MLVTRRNFNWYNATISAVGFNRTDSWFDRFAKKSRSASEVVLQTLGTNFISRQIGESLEEENGMIRAKDEAALAF